MSYNDSDSSIQIAQWIGEHTGLDKKKRSSGLKTREAEINLFTKKNPLLPGFSKFSGPLSCHWLWEGDLRGIA